MQSDQGLLCLCANPLPVFESTDKCRYSVDIMIVMFILMTKSPTKTRIRAFIRRFQHKNEHTAQTAGWGAQYIGILNRRTMRTPTEDIVYKGFHWLFIVLIHAQLRCLEILLHICQLMQ